MGTVYVYMAMLYVTGIAPGVKAETLKAILESFPGMGQLNVYRTNLCHNYRYQVTWASNTGTQALIEVTETSLAETYLNSCIHVIIHSVNYIVVCSIQIYIKSIWFMFYLQVASTTTLTGSNPSVSVARVASGGLMHAPVLGHMLRTSHTTPQVTLRSNGILARNDVDLDYTWDTALDVTVSGIDTNTGELTLNSHQYN